MFELRSGSLTVSVLDPVADQHLLSSAEGYRYCSGGYIWQATDAVRGALLTGPNGDAPPGVTNGQGIPDSFNLRPIWDGFYAGKAQEAPAGHALIIGIGEVDLNYEHDPALPEAEQPPHGGITKLCRWDIERSEQQLTFRTAHSFGQYNLELVKTVALSGRTLRTTFAIKNLGSELPFTWFPHPFFPNVGPPGEDELCRFTPAATFVDGREAEPGFSQDPVSGFISRRLEVPGMGYAQLADKTTPLTVTQNHPAVGTITGICSFSPTYLPIWGNENAFSWEPFLERWLAPGEEYEWSIDYLFGMAAGAEPAAKPALHPQVIAFRDARVALNLPPNSAVTPDEARANSRAWRAAIPA